MILWYSVRISWNSVDLRRKYTRHTQDETKWLRLCPWRWLSPQLPTIEVGLININSKILENNNLNLARWKKIKNCVPSALWSIHELSQNPFTKRSFRWKKIKILFTSALWCFQVLSQTTVMTQKLSKIGCFPGITWQISNQSQQVNTFLLSTLKMILQSILKFGPTAQICAKTPKFETPILIFLRIHARRLWMAYSTWFPPYFQPGKWRFSSFTRLYDSSLTLTNVPKL